MVKFENFAIASYNRRVTAVVNYSKLRR